MLSFDYGVRDDLGPGVIGVGAYLGYSSYKWDEPFETYGWRRSNLIAGGMGTYHYEFIERFDTYAGLMLGLQFINYEKWGTWPFPREYNSTDLKGSIFIGGKYFFDRNLGGFFEIGYGTAFLTFGVSLKI